MTTWYKDLKGRVAIYVSETLWIYSHGKVISFYTSGSHEYFTIKLTDIASKAYLEDKEYLDGVQSYTLIESVFELDERLKDQSYKGYCDKNDCAFIKEILPDLNILLPDKLKYEDYYTKY